MSFTQTIAWETLRSIDSSGFTGSYQLLGGPLLYPSIILKIVNNSNALVTISIDGSTDIDVVPATSFTLYDELKYGNPNYQFVRAGTQFFVKGASSVSNAGLVYLVSQYLVHA